MPPGPVPNRSEDLTRPRERRGGEYATPVTKGVALPTTWPDAPEEWCEIAKMAYESIQRSGQASFLQQSDVAMAYMLCENLDFYQTQTWSTSGDRKRSPEMLKALLTGFSNILMTEGDRRRVKIELDEPSDPKAKASLTVLAEYQEGLAAPASAPSPDSAEESS